jgi:hypothetical protein
MASNIGIKIANGEFYPLIEENSLIKKKMILTTVHDNQTSTQIDLYRSDAKVMSEAQYIGTLVVDNIKPRPKGEASIEMVISSNASGEIIADAIDLDTSGQGEHYVLTVSLKSVDETSKEVELPEFDLDNEEPPTGLYNHAKNIRKEKERKSLAWLFTLIILIVILGLIGVWLFFFNGLDTVQSKWPGIQKTVKEKVIEPAKENIIEPVKRLGGKAKQLFSKGSASVIWLIKRPSPVSEPAIVVTPATSVVNEPVTVVVNEPVVVTVLAEPPPVTTQTVQTVQTTQTVASNNVPLVIPREGVNYRIRWGDTLRDISETFYRDPELYTRIASNNNIRNPNYIISGRIIRIPPKN